MNSQSLSSSTTGRNGTTRDCGRGDGRPAGLAGGLVAAIVCLMAGVAAAQPAKTPAAGAKKPTPPIVVKAVIDGGDAVRIVPEGFEWHHRTGKWPTEVTINGKPWDPQKQQMLKGPDLAPYLPAGMVFGSPELTVAEGRGEVSLRRGMNGAFRLDLRDPADGSAPVAAEIRFRDLSWLSTGTPKAPEPDRNGAYPGDVRIVVQQVEGVESVGLFKDRATWQHAQGQPPGNATVNGVEWKTPAKNKVLPNEGDTKFFSRSAELFAATGWRLRGRGNVHVGMAPNTVSVDFSDPEPGADDFEVVIHEREVFAKIEPPPEVEARVAQMFAAVPIAPYGAGKDLPTEKDFENLRRAWRRGRLTAAYEEFGRPSPAWKEAAQAFIELDVPLEKDQKPARDIIAAGYELIDQGCDEPMVCYVLARHLTRADRVAEAEPFARHAVLTFEKTSYPPRAVRAATALLARILTNAPDVSSAERANDAYRLARRWCAETLETARGPLSNDERRALLAEIRDAFADPAAIGHEAALVRMIVDAGRCDPWLTHMLQADYLHGLALRESNRTWSIPDDDRSRDPFPVQLAQVRAHAVTAWGLHPELPEAAVRAMVSLVGRPEGGESARFWFDQAVAAQFDAPGAHATFLLTQRQRSGGIPQAVFDFGLECLRTGRYDTQVPGFFFEALRVMAEDGPPLREVLEFLKAGDELRQAFVDSERGKAGEELQKIRTRNVALAHRMGWEDDAKRRMEELGDGFVASTGKIWGTTRERIRYDLDYPLRPWAGARFIENPQSVRDTDDEIFGMTVAPDGQFIAIETLYEGGALMVQLWNVADEQQSRNIYPSEAHRGYSIRFSPDSSKLALVEGILRAGEGPKLAQSSWLIVWDKADRKSRRLSPKGYANPYSLDWLPDNRHLAVGTTANVVILDPATNTPLAATPDFKQKAGPVAVASVDRLMAVGFVDGTISLYRHPTLDALKPGAKPAFEHVADLKRHIGQVDRLLFSPDGKKLASQSAADTSIWVWDIAKGKPRFRLPGLHFAFSPDSRRLATAGGSGPSFEVAVWNLETEEALARCQRPEEAQYPTSVAFDASGEFVLASTADGGIFAWQLAAP